MVKVVIYLETFEILMSCSGAPPIIPKLPEDGANVERVTTNTLLSASPDRLRADTVAQLKERGSIRSPEVAEAFARVPREKFAPEASSLSAAYSAMDIVITKRNAAGKATSSVSAPWLQAEMLEAARLAPGARVLEIGSGGYNAALIAEIAGPEGLVVTVDIDPFVTERATRFLPETGYPQVKVVLGDAEHAAEEHGPYDAILVTVGAWDCPWGHLLAPGGRMVVPLRFCGITRSITFIREGDRFVGLNPTVCGFVPMQGAGAHQEQVAALADGAVTLTIDAGPALNTSALDLALADDPTEVWTGVVVVSTEPFGTLHLWLATVDDTFGLIWRDPDRDSDVVKPAVRWFCPALVTPDSFAYLTVRERDCKSERLHHHEFGVHGHGRHGAEPAHRLLTHVQTWDRDRRHGHGPDFTLYPADTAMPVPAIGRIFPKRHTQMVIAWP
ncbi:methyltransferase, FxLD system [Nonomuraea sp. CA-141351]|uniref:methyltransferase, FxLD system n=1 Tax=Nonomuraea sp. CA-141351 TaxID=3239996 RepID=UPI003D9075F5